jgi:hypothetical protein
VGHYDLKPDTQPYQQIREYLLGKSSSEDSALVEEQLLADEEFYQQLLVVEDELVDQYLAGLLPDPEKGPFENYFLAAPERREKLRFTRNLKRYVSRAEADRAPVADYTKVVSARNVSPALPPPKRFSFWPNPILSYSLAAAAVVIVALAGIMIFKLQNAPPHTGKALAVELVPGLSRGDTEIKQIAVPADTATLQLQLRGSNFSDYQTYHAILQTADGSEVSRQENLRPDPGSRDRIICPISATLLKPGDYSLKLRGLNQQNDYDDVARYYFRITK